MMKPNTLFFALLVTGLQAEWSRGSEEYSLPKCEVVPLANDEAAFQIDGIEKARWHFGSKYPRPFFFPFHGPAGKSLTRMRHPGAPNHDHHRSIWIGHHRVDGNDFWSDTKGNTVRQKLWNCYLSGDEAVMASTCGWFDQDNVELAEQQMVASLIPFENDEHALEIQISIQPPSGKDSVTIEKSNFGFLAIRVAKSISAIFGGGKISNSEGDQTEENVFGKRARWVDYSGPIAIGKGKERSQVVEGLTCFDHPSNPRYPTYWHVRDDGWLGASFCMEQSYTIPANDPLVLRYLIYAHSGAYDNVKSEKTHQVFSHSKRFRVFKSSKPHHQFEVERLENQ